MRIARYRSFGPARDVLHLAEIGMPNPRPGEVRVRLRTSGINPYDVKFRNGAYTQHMVQSFVVPHCDGAGIIDAVGDGVTADRLGERVWIWGAAQGELSGTAAEAVTLPQMQAPRLPDGLSFEDGACLGIPYLTAYQNLLRDGSVEGQTILVSGGGGAVGFLAVQMARLKGARVIATAGSRETQAHARLAGADEVIDYRGEDLIEAILAANAGNGVDRIVEVEFGRNLPLVSKVLRAGGIVSSYGSAAQTKPTLDFLALQACGATLHFRSVHQMDPKLRQEAIAELGAFCAQGLAFPATRALPLDAIIEAHEAVESGAGVRRVILEIADASSLTI